MIIGVIFGVYMLIGVYMGIFIGYKLASKRR